MGYNKISVQIGSSMDSVVVDVIAGLIAAIV